MKLEDLTIARCAVCGHSKTAHWIFNDETPYCKDCDFSNRHWFVLAQARPVVEKAERE